MIRELCVFTLGDTSVSNGYIFTFMIWFVGQTFAFVRVDSDGDVVIVVKTYHDHVARFAEDHAVSGDRSILGGSTGLILISILLEQGSVDDHSRSEFMFEEHIWAVFWLNLDCWLMHIKRRLMRFTFLSTLLLLSLVCHFRSSIVGQQL